MGALCTKYPFALYIFSALPVFSQPLDQQRMVQVEIVREIGFYLHTEQVANVLWYTGSAEVSSLYSLIIPNEARYMKGC